jgi:hypothetical protein
MRWVCLIVLSSATLLTGCHHPKQPPVSPPLNYSFYHGQPFSWGAVSRVLVLPLRNETSFSHASEEAQNALVTELQQLGRFEVVPAPDDICTDASRYVRVNGRFNELALIQMAHDFRADVIIMGTLTQYSPYKPVRMGLSLQVVSPVDGLIVASVAGLWDSANAWIAQRARDYYLQFCRRRDEPLTAELVLDSPRFYQRFVCFEAVHILVGDFLPGVPPKPGAAGSETGPGSGEPGAGPACSPSAPPSRTGPPPSLLPPPLPDNPVDGKLGPGGPDGSRPFSRLGSS